MTRLTVIACVLIFTGIAASAAEPFPLRDGDVVAFVGNTFLERDQRDGYIELALTLSAPNADVSFRNLGWSGDTVDGRARRYFGSTEEGYKHLLDHLDAVKPTVIVVCYGTNEAFDGEARRAGFIEGYSRLLEDLRKRTERILLVSAPPLEPGSSPAPAVAKRVNQEITKQSEAVRELAGKYSLGFVDLFTPMHKMVGGGNDTEPLTDNGLHLTPRGYRIAANEIVEGVAESTNASTDVAEALSESEERLRQAIVEKNMLFFHRHRPENETYLRGFRKHEQGNNAAEIYAFEPLVAEKDREIFERRKAAMK
ncbi:MAG: SGNH/GDSL hydrolase family protein [Planctomycetaceae bacterium]|nr:SGNH/GDSL hydrolase family protein [Planctomycetaceae bacterium]